MKPGCSVSKLRFDILTAVIAFLSLALPAASHVEPGAEARYLANEGVLIAYGDVKIMFDPLFDQAFGTYALVPENMRAAMMAGEPPFDGVDAIFVSHVHGDHFAAPDVLDYLRSHPDVRLVMPAQGLTALRTIAQEGDDSIIAQVEALDIAVGDPPTKFEWPGLMVEVVAVPHAGGQRHARVRNHVHRITLDGSATVIHMGDADPQLMHYEALADHWASRRTHLSMPPYWFFTNPQSARIPTDTLNAAHAIGIHVPVGFARPPLMGAKDLFTQPGETRTIDLSQMPD